MNSFLRFLLLVPLGLIGLGGCSEDQPPSKYNLGEVKIKNGKVQPIRGVSLELDPADAAKHGMPRLVKSIPEELEIVQQGRRLGHHEIRPKVEMPVERFEELLKQVALEPI